ncbi:hypothetical protein BU16DRAFT_556601 [Lophium mytilinum]|uniref:NACHT domain-containing protein n=1 Tax=Lophium mytilinum TaxID=390894 RepID=A0A6A6R5U2_9PEZI|nr:hypothetical protein BU16DRAFT_556601 [Lophium mytilinum]
MEALAAFGLAAGILQIVDLSAKLLSAGYQIYESGSTIRTSEYALVVDDLSSLNDKIKLWARPDTATMGPLPQDNQALENLADKCAKIADELIAVLVKIQIEGGTTKFKTFQLAIATRWNSSKIKEIAERLEAIRAELQFRILVSMKDTVDQIALRKEVGRQSFDEATATIVACILDGKADLAAIVAAQTGELIRRQKASDVTAEQRHAETVAEIRNLPHVLGQGFTTSRDVDPQDVFRNIKARLNFDQKWDRFEDIAVAHQKTFDWVFHDPSKRQAPWSNFGQWLREGNGVYWVSGKAGSGKSTLMKLLNQDSRLKQALELWAGETPLVLTSFYFWNSGTEPQKTQQGLFRSIVLDALRQRPDLGPILFPERYEPGASWNEFPTFHQLRRAFEKLTTQTDVPIQLVMLIDGLDEFEPTNATMIDLAEIFLVATKSRNVKAVLSSRPLSAFEAAFSDQPKLRLHELTEGDIREYVDDKLSGHSRMLELAEDDAAGTKILITEIVDTASGVFLWVKLVVRELLVGLQNYDVLEDMHRRLRKLPRDLEQLFMHMLRNIPEDYKTQSSRMFQVFRCYVSVAEPESWSLPLTGIGMLFTEYSRGTILEANIAPLSSSELQRRHNEIKMRLTSHCAGLIEMPTLRTRSFRSGDEEGQKEEGDEEVQNQISREESESSQTEKTYITQQLESVETDAPVQYLHKSVADFLQKERVWEEIREATKDTSFDPNVANLQSLVMRLKCSSGDHRSEDRFGNGISSPLRDGSQLIMASMRFAELAEESTGTAQEEILDEMAKTMAIFFETEHKGKTRELYASNWYDTLYENGKEPVPWHDTMLFFAIRSGLKLYTEAKIKKQKNGLPKREGKPLLAYACRPEPIWATLSIFINPGIVQILLDNGADPNEKFNGLSPFQHALITHTHEPIGTVAILKLLVQHGADPNAYVDRVLSKKQDLLWHHHRQSALCLIQEEYERYASSTEDQDVKEELLDLIKALKQKGARVEEYWVERGEDNSARKEKSVRQRIRRHVKELFKKPS